VARILALLAREPSRVVQVSFSCFAGRSTFRRLPSPASQKRFARIIPPTRATRVGLVEHSRLKIPAASEEDGRIFQQVFEEKPVGQMIFE
jgi:hypothetical protein